GEAGLLRPAPDDVPARAARRGALVREPPPHRDGPRDGHGRPPAAARRAQRRHEPARDGRDHRDHQAHARRGRLHDHARRAQDEPGQGHLRPRRRPRLRTQDRRGLVRRGRERARRHRGLPRQARHPRGRARRAGAGAVSAEAASRPAAGPAGAASAGREKLLELRGVDTHYGPIQVLRNVDMVIYPGEMVCLLGGNASGKSTTLKTVLGLVRPSAGEVWYRGERVDGLTTAERIARGMAVVPENRRIFPKLTVLENLDMGAYLRDDKDGIQEDLEYVFTLFPRLGERLNQLGGTMSGGEQQMLAMGLALMSRPKLILMDEPSMGLAPLFVERIFEII